MRFGMRRSSLLLAGLFLLLTAVSVQAAGRYFEAEERIEEGLAAEAAHEAAMNEKPSNEEMDLERHDDSAPVAEVGEDAAEA